MSKFALCFALLAITAQAAPVHLRTNGLNTPIGLDTPKPTFSWLSDATTPNWVQSAYEILIDPDVKNLRAGHAASWDSGRIVSSESLDIAYAGVPLKPQQRYAWKVITWDNKGKGTASVATWFETGLMSASEWKAQWITRKDPLVEEELRAIRWMLRPPRLHTSATNSILREHLLLGACTFLPAESSLRMSMARSLAITMSGAHSIEKRSVTSFIPAKTKLRSMLFRIARTVLLPNRLLRSRPQFTLRAPTALRYAW
jgi:hypothetical protein